MGSFDPFNVAHGADVTLAPGLRRIVAPNPSAMTHAGTNTYLIGTRGLAVIDPGPANGAHLEAILAAVRTGQQITHIMVTHAHLDHSELAPALARRTGAPVFGFGPAHMGRSAIMDSLSDSGQVGGGEGVDTGFRPDVLLEDGAKIEGDDWCLEAMHTPGHIGNHLCFGFGDQCLTGDLVMGWSSSLVSPPDGDLTDFLSSCRRLLSHGWRIFHPGHGPPVNDPTGRLDWLIRHREARTREILDALAQGAQTPADIARQIYSDVPPGLLVAATRNVLAHLIDLVQKGEVSSDGDLGVLSLFRIPDEGVCNTPGTNTGH